MSRPAYAAVLALVAGAAVAEDLTVFTVGSGDLIGASPLLSGLFHDEPAIEALNEIGLDVSGVGNHTAAAKAIATSQAKIVTQLGAQQQSMSGVNLDEEYGELLRFQQYYMANAQVIQTASSLFDALLNIR